MFSRSSDHCGNGALSIAENIRPSIGWQVCYGIIMESHPRNALDGRTARDKSITALLMYGVILTIGGTRVLHSSMIDLFDVVI